MYIVTCPDAVPTAVDVIGFLASPLVDVPVTLKELLRLIVLEIKSELNIETIVIYRLSI